ncbi:uncharacterized protein KGF55_002010 [Candida pseudojiufengensis]|uniref:uncharacterized protein n=1 Tax=Candida pseudojiufengensis TaxID=497109 RepID=UPI00222457B8|nr:uncharacterized protein KGF55_002010 [Candida pseudojiufengensis]KAI5964068.1 hypothetical protein KGF55_002010 [Candida pseudojiufengensis]
MSTTKLPRATLAEKIRVLDYYHSSNSSQLKTVDIFKNEVAISTSSLSEWIKNEQELRTRYSQDDFKMSKNSKRKATFKYEKINKAMDKLVQTRLEKGEPINEPILREHWSIYAHQYGVDDPKRLNSFSHGWLSQFKKRHGLKKSKKEKPTVEYPNVDPVLNEVNSATQAPTQPPPPQPQLQPPQAQPQPQTQSQSQSQPPVSDVDVERFIFVHADKFFHNHQNQYPNTFNIFQKFKESFFDERFASRNA